MKRAASVLLLICGAALLLPAQTLAFSRTYAVDLTVKMKFDRPQRISGKVSSSFPACRAHRRIQVQALDGSGRTELVTDDSGAFEGSPRTPILRRKAYRVKVLRSVARGEHGAGSVCASAVAILR
jgi:hypothetical protein